MKRILAFVLAACLCLCGSGVGAFASGEGGGGMTGSFSSSTVDYTAPAHGLEADDSVVTGAAYVQGVSVYLSILGVDLVSSNGAGVYGGGSTSSYGTDSATLGIFGSDINENPDPYLYNFFYDINTYETAGNDYSDEEYASWTATPYILRWDGNRQLQYGQAAATVTISLLGEPVTCNPAFFYEPDLILDSAAGYADVLASYRETYNSEYDPVFFDFGGYSDSEQALLDLGAVIDELCAAEGKSTRYGSAYEIAVDYAKYNEGLVWWVESQFASGDMVKLRYAYNATYDPDLDMWAVVDGTGGTSGFARPIADNIYDLLTDGYVFSDGSVVEACENTSAYNSHDLSDDMFLLTTSQMEEILTVTADGAAYPGVIMGNADSYTAYEELQDSGITFFSNFPAAGYSDTPNSVTENGLAVPFALSYFYYDQCGVLTPTNVLAYWLEHFYHVTDTDAMQEVLENMMQNADTNHAYNAVGSVNMDEYDADALEGLIIDGIAYYHEVEDTLAEADLWLTLDDTVGIGS